ncbi:MAG: hydantoinase B/oxoprolinase family protein, partial [Acidimicrobiia bacterium]
ISGILNSLMVLLGYGLPKCPEAILRSIDIDSRPGTFVHAVHPAGCSKATTAACHAILMAFNVGMSKMYGDVEEFHSRILAGSGGFLPVIDIEGTDRQGGRFGAPLLDVALAAGYGAMPGRDGIDSAGPLHSPFAAISNVETYEARYPLLYLWRRQETDSGGLGRRRGGRGVSLAWTPHKAGSSVGVVLHGHGCAVASTPGTGGGYPGATNTFALARGTGSRSTMAAGQIPQDESQLGTDIEHPSGLHMTRLEEGDVVIACNNGGGGFGDPLSREPDRVLVDVRLGAVSPEWARHGYGVVVDGDEVDLAATTQLREELRSRRLARRPDGELPANDSTPGPRQCAGCGSNSQNVIRNRRRLS